MGNAMQRKPRRILWRQPGGPWSAASVAAALSVIGAGAVAQPNAGHAVILKTVSHDAVQGRLISLTLDDGVVLESSGSDRQRIAFEELVRLRTNAPASTRPRQDYTLRLANGDVLDGRIVAGDGDTVVIEASWCGRLVVPLESIMRIDAARATQAGHREAANWFMRRKDVDQDAILLTNGDVLQGFLKSIDAIGAAIEGDLGENLVPHRLIVAVRLASPVFARLELPHALIVLRSGCRLTVTEFDWIGNSVAAAHVGGQRLRFEANQVAEIEFVGGRWEWLSAHQPISFEHTPMLSVGWEYSIDRNVLGEPIEVEGRRFDHGLGVHSRSRLVYALQGNYEEFVTFFGIDDHSGPRADVSVSVLVDGQRRLAEKYVRRGKLYGPIRINVARANRIELVVDFGENGNLQDRFNWVEPALIR